MKGNKNISFVRVDILENWRFWNQFYKTGDYEAAGREVIAQANALLEQDYESNERAAALLREGKEFQTKKQLAGQKGGRTRVANSRKSNELGNDQTDMLDAENGNVSDDRKAPPSSEPFGDTSTGDDEDDCKSGMSPNIIRGSAKPSCGSPAIRTRRILPPPSTESVYEFAQKEGLDEADAREWYEINFVDRPGCDKDGVVIENWKGHCKNFCKAAAKRRAG